ncbi:hypothetical protein CSKR_112940 [Clonorchis sinensis]|uniref:FYVE-type domain-containing protein n=1 Tax=Clonorchis sinensis TaxID=79923 RepID=A0A8T1MJQ2_CLOSI|nr:hypothetical protein CSKR_112940 [Clonorchis sinensis]
MQKNDVLIDFYLATVKVQSHEFHLCHSSLSEDDSTVLLRETEQVRRELGQAMFNLLNSALPSCCRESRVYRTKYTEEVDIRNLEKCLVAAANKVVTFDPSASPREMDLRPAQPSASAFLDVLSQVQCLVANQIELALAATDRALLSKREDEDKTDIQSGSSGSVGSVSATLLRQRSPERTPDLDALPTNPMQATDPIPDAAAPSASASSSNARDNRITMATVQVKIGPRTYGEMIRLPPLSSLLIAEELCLKLVDLDEAAADFEFAFVRSLSRRLRTAKEANDLQLVTVLFSETLMWGLAIRLFTMQQLADRDPCILLSLPRLAVLVGLRILPDSPIGTSRLAAGRRLPYMFSKSRSDLAYLTRQLYALRLDQLCRLVRWLGPRGLPNFTGSGHSKASSTNQSFGSSPTRSGSPANQCEHSSPSRPIPVVQCQRSSGSPVHRSGRLWRTHLAGLHRIYKRVSEVADRFSNEYPTELRFILQSCVEMHDTSREVAAIAQMEGRDLDEQEGATDSGESSEVALESEVHLGEHVFADASKSYSALAQLLDWSGVVSCRKIKQSLSDVLKTSYSHFERTKPGTPELSPGSPTKHAVDEASECDQQQNESISLELGLDVAAWLADDRHRDNRSSRHETQASCFPRCSTELNRTDGTATSEPTTFSQKMSKLNLGTAVEGKRTSDDRLFHYLPPWQPDRLGDLSSSHTEVTDSDEASESDQFSESDQSPVLVIGRRCASCLQSFTIFRRRHHCRRCGHIFCGSCCNKWQTVEGLATTKAVRICSECHEFLNTSV